MAQMTEKERTTWVKDHINNYGMSEQEAAAVVDAMTDSEVAAARAYGIGSRPNKETIADVIARCRANSPAAAIQAPKPSVNVQEMFFTIVKTLCASRGRQFVETADFVANCKKIIDWVLVGPKADKWLLIAGSVGNGKTTAARAAFITLRQSGMEGIEKNAYDIGLLFREVGRNTRAAEEYDRLTRCPLLFVDDLGTENNPAALNEILYERYNQMRLTIFTTNLSRAELSAKYGPRIFDRFEELAAVIRFTGSSFRTKNRQTTLAF